MKSIGPGARRPRSVARLMLTVAGAIAFFSWQPAAQSMDTRAAGSPTDLLRQVRDHYRSLSSFAMRIEHQDSSGLYPGRYTQRLRWRRGGHFELLVTSKGNRRVPDFYADGRHVLWSHPDHRWSPGELVPEPNTAPGWEVSGGPIVSWLQDTWTGRAYLEPPKEMQLSWQFGPRTEWRGQRVREIVGTIGGRRDASFSLFVDAQRKLLVGVEYQVLVGAENQASGKVGWAVYADQQINPALLATVGNAPATRPGADALGRKAAVCTRHLQAIYRALAAYRHDHGDFPPIYPISLRVTSATRPSSTARWTVLPGAPGTRRPW
jgi:hypothetical protein